MKKRNLKRNKEEEEEEEEEEENKKKKKNDNKRRESKIEYVKGFVPPSIEEINQAVGCYPFTNDNNKIIIRERTLLKQIEYKQEQEEQEREQEEEEREERKITKETLNQINEQIYYQNNSSSSSSTTTTTTTTNKKTKKESLFWESLPEPADEGSWLANVNEPGQTFDEYVKFITLRSGKFKPNSNVENSHIFLLPLSENNEDWPQTGPDLEIIQEYVSIFFCRKVIILDTIQLEPNKSRLKSYKPITWRTHTHECQLLGRISTNLPSRFQTHVDGLLTEIAAIREEGIYNEKKIENAFAIVGVTMSDIYSGDSDLFVAGMAAGGSKVAVLSLNRYHPNIKMCPFHWDDYSYISNSSNYSYFEDNKKRPKTKLQTPQFHSLSSTSRSEFIRRTGKLIVHEICHVYGIDHCIHYHCLMNGTGHLVEDFSAPSHLCPVCLRKLQFRLGFDIKIRYEKLFLLYSKCGMEKEAKWVEKRLQYLNSELNQTNLNHDEVIIVEENNNEDNEEKNNIEEKEEIQPKKRGRKMKELELSIESKNKRNKKKSNNDNNNNNNNRRRRMKEEDNSNIVIDLSSP